MQAKIAVEFQGCSQVQRVRQTSAWFQLFVCRCQLSCVVGEPTVRSRRVGSEPERVTPYVMASLAPSDPYPTARMVWEAGQAASPETRPRETVKCGTRPTRAGRPVTRTEPPGISSLPADFPAGFSYAIHGAHSPFFLYGKGLPAFFGARRR